MPAARRRRRAVFTPPSSSSRCLAALALLLPLVWWWPPDAVLALHLTSSRSSGRMSASAGGPRRGFRFGIDRGGTFTDVYCELPSGKIRVLKLLSEDPANYPDAPREGIRRILQEETGKPHPRDSPVDTSQIESIRMGTTVATNALLERKGERCALVTTAGFKDLLRIGNQSRPRIFDLEICRPDLLYEAVVEVKERIALDRDGEGGIEDQAGVDVGVTGEKVRVISPPDLLEARRCLQKVLDAGITSIAVVFLHSYLYPRHEEMVGDLAKQMGFSHVSLSSEVMPMVRMVPRGYTTAADAYLTPIVRRYISSFASGFDQDFSKVRVLFMQSDGGLTPVESFRGSRAILSGPAGGVVGTAVTAGQAVSSPEPGAKPQPIMALDMGGTSTDVSRYHGTYEHVFETVTAGVSLQSPQLDISTVAAGGGSRLFYQNSLFVVGPESAGAHPGPVCYRKGGLLAVTDANVFLGRVVPRHFPAIFGPNEDEPLDVEGPRQAFEALAKEVGGGKTADEVALGFIRVANEAMCRPMRNLTTMKGHDLTSHALGCFGGAGPQHACAIARALGISSILIHRHAGVLSALGLSAADLVVEKQEPAAATLSEEDMPNLESRLDSLQVASEEELMAQGFERSDCKFERYLNLRFKGTDTSIMTSEAEAHLAGGFVAAFEAHYKREFGFVLRDRAILVDDIRVRGAGVSSRNFDASAGEIPGQASGDSVPEPVPVDTSLSYWDGLGRVETPVFLLGDLVPNQTITGPAILMQDVSTVVIEPQCIATVTSEGDLEIQVGEAGSGEGIGTEVDPIYLSLFSHRFMGIAEQMGRTLQRTSISVNIKERLDFSCAIFDASGGLVANAPHLPVHLGAMQEAVRFQLAHWTAPGSEGLQEGDVLVSNHPQLAGGSHLPDITVITPVFYEGRISFFVASRGHHADVGGIAPGSMPPLSKSLSEEGVAIIAYKLMRQGVYQEDGIKELLRESRNLSDNLSDLRAQVAANTKGGDLMQELVREYGFDVVSAYMGHIQSNAESAVRNMLKGFASRHGIARDSLAVAEAEDFMDDGTPIKLKVTVDANEGTAVFDFTGTGPEIFGNLNAPPSVTYSAVIYSLRCLVPDVDIPLNQGCLQPVDIIIPKGTLLNPSPEAAVVGGNVLTSQRVTDVILKAFGACAASQGCMNNLTFGDTSMGYYETIAGGAGAGPTWHGASGVHTHMTNTRITDPEILERRYPVLLQAFGLRRGSGGEGKFRGGDGVVRSLRFRRPLTVSILSERRALKPFGLMGGADAARGLNLLTVAKSRKTVSLGGKNTVNVSPGDVLSILTPGGGGYGKLDVRSLAGEANQEEHEDEKEGGSLLWVGAGHATDKALPPLAGSEMRYKLAQEQA